jgi:hypothetical protein
MARIVEEVVIIKVSKLVKDHHTHEGLLATPEFVASLEQIAQELAGEDVVVEVQSA